MTLIYATGGGRKKRYYKIKKRKKKDRNGKIIADVSRVKCAEYDDRKTNPNIGQVRPKVGDKVIIIVKPYQEYKCITGIVKDVLTRKAVHTRGHKVRLESGDIGRTLKILKK